jgi:uncharacterized phage protein (TIGR01671 family)
MREIKFRLWQTIWPDKELQIMHPVTEIDFANKVYFVETSMAGYFFKDAILMQYTNLKDKNGIEIYEGDILKVGVKHGFHGYLLEEFKNEKQLDTLNGIGLHFVGVVRIDLQRGLMFENYKTGYQEPMFSRKRDIFAYHSDIEVIGNIYKTPNLLV